MRKREGEPTWDEEKGEDTMKGGRRGGIERRTERAEFGICSFVSNPSDSDRGEKGRNCIRPLELKEGCPSIINGGK